MRLPIFVAFLSVAALAAPTAGRAQLHATGSIVNGHHHFNAGNVDEHMRFWVDTLGGTAGTFANGAPIVLFPNALIFMRDRAPAGAMIGSSVDHVAFSVQSLRTTVDRVIANGYEMITETAAPPGVQVVDDIGIVAGNGPVSGIAYAVGPDGIKVEILEMRAQEQPIVSHHIHFFGPDAAAMRAWYMDVFGAAERPGNINGIIGADLPGLGLNFSTASGPTAGTAGRVLDHIGFEVENLEGFTERLEARGIKLDVTYREVEALGIAIAFVSDPWGTSIELTEGLDKVGKEAPESP